MPTAAIAAYGVQLRLGDGVSPGGVTISAASNTTPIVLTTTAHGIPIGGITWVNVAGVLGNLGANGLWVAEATTTTGIKLRGSVGTGAYTSGGTMTIRDTFTTVAELVNLTPVGISFNMVDASAHDGAGWGTSIPTMKQGVAMRVELNFVPNHPTHNFATGIMGLALQKIRRDWLIVLPDSGKTTVAFQAWVSDHGTVTPHDGVLRCTPVLSIDGPMSWNYT
jgi:hypothetical protein